MLLQPAAVATFFHFFGNTIFHASFEWNTEVEILESQCSATFLLCILGKQFQPVAFSTSVVVVVIWTLSRSLHNHSTFSRRIMHYYPMVHNHSNVRF